MSKKDPADLSSVLPLPPFKRYKKASKCSKLPKVIIFVEWLLSCAILLFWIMTAVLTCIDMDQDNSPHRVYKRLSDGRSLRGWQRNADNGTLDYDNYRDDYAGVTTKEYVHDAGAVPDKYNSRDVLPDFETEDHSTKDSAWYQGRTTEEYKMGKYPYSELTTAGSSDDRYEEDITPSYNPDQLRNTDTPRADQIDNEPTLADYYNGYRPHDYNTDNMQVSKLATTGSSDERYGETEGYNSWDEGRYEERTTTDYNSDEWTARRTTVGYNRYAMRAEELTTENYNYRNVYPTTNYYNDYTTRAPRGWYNRTKPSIFGDVTDINWRSIQTCSGGIAPWCGVIFLIITSTIGLFAVLRKDNRSSKFTFSVLVFGASCVSGYIYITSGVNALNPEKWNDQFNGQWKWALATRVAMLMTSLLAMANAALLLLSSCYVITDCLKYCISNRKQWMNSAQKFKKRLMDMSPSMLRPNKMTITVLPPSRAITNDPNEPVVSYNANSDAATIQATDIDAKQCETPKAVALDMEDVSSPEHDSEIKESFKYQRM